MKRHFPIYLALALTLLCFANTSAQKTSFRETRVVVESDGWKIVGDLVVPNSRRKLPAVILLNKANGNRKVYENLAKHLAMSNIASFRVDLRGHGESINKGKFVPFQENSPDILNDTDKDISAVFQFLKKVKGIDSSRIGLVGASYSGEEMAVSARKIGYAKAYVALSPGSFSQDSINRLDQSAAAWLFIKSADERARTLKDFFSAIRQKSRTAQTLEVNGAEHASDILNAHAELAEIITVWFKHKL